MMTLKQMITRLETIPASISWYLADLGEARGKQELFTRQSPQQLKTLREHALIESAVSSNRIEGIEVDKSRVATIVFGKPLLRDRNEEEVRGYRQALNLIHEQGSKIPVSEETILKLHRLTRGKIPPPVLLAAFNLDFLCIHPFRDGNGRVSRLLLLLQCYHLGFEVGRYISLERLIEQNKERYYETLEQSSHGWHEGKHDPWPYISYILFIIRIAYREFEERLSQIGIPKGEKTSLVLRAIDRTVGPFRIAEIQNECPNISVDMIRLVLKNLRAKNQVECLGRGQNAHWRKTGEWQLGKIQ
jgi:Fic family protein